VATAPLCLIRASLLAILENRRKSGQNALNNVKNVAM
jgi:hypothetical protein